MKVWSTDDVSARESFSYWNDAVCDAFLRVRTERDERASFQGHIRSSAAGALVVNHVSSQAHLVRRSRQTLCHDTRDWFFLNLHTVGECSLAQAGRDHYVVAGDLSFHDSTRPFDLTFPRDMELTCFVIPREALIARSVDAAAQVARPVPNEGVGALLRRFASAYADAAPTFSTAVREQAATMFVDLLALALGANATGREAGRTSARRVLFDRVCARIRLRLGDPALDLANVAMQAGVAPRTLQTLFQEHHTTFTAYVLEQRLLAAERQLDCTRASVTDIAYAVGFSDLSYFSRAFRRRFGVSASERRLQHVVDDGAWTEQ